MTPDINTFIKVYTASGDTFYIDPATRKAYASQGGGGPPTLNEYPINDPSPGARQVKDAYNAYFTSVDAGISNPTPQQYQQNLSPTYVTAAQQAATLAPTTGTGYQAPTQAPATNTLAYYQSQPNVQITNPTNYNNNQPILNYSGNTAAQPTQNAGLGIPNYNYYGQNNATPTQQQPTVNPLWLQQGESIDAYNTRIASMSPNLPAPGTTSSTGVTNSATSGAISSANMGGGSQLPYTQAQTQQGYNAGSYIPPGGDPYANTAQQNKVQGDINNIQSLNTQAAGRDAFQTQQNQAFGVDAAYRTKQDLGAKLTALATRSQGLSLESQYTIPNQNQLNFEGRGVTKAGTAPILTSDLRRNSIQQGALAQESLTAQAAYAAADGNLVTAQHFADQAVQERFGPIEAETKAAIANLQLALNSPDYNNAEKKQAQAQLDFQNQKAAAIAQQKSDAANILEVVSKAASLQADAMTLQKIGSAKTPQEALQILASTGLLKTSNEGKMQFVAGTDNQPSGYFDPSTGKFTSYGGGVGGKPTGSAEIQLAQNKSQIESLSGLLGDSYLTNAVGPNSLARFSLLSSFTGGKSNFIAGIEQIRSQLNLDALINAKARGATFGALSDQELQVLSSSATKIGTWAQKDSSGNIVGYNASESDFKRELDKINNFAKLDYIIKGGDPMEVGGQLQSDGSIWVANSDGTLTQIR